VERQPMSEFMTKRLMVRARQMATNAHRGQRYNDGPYTDHLDHTVAVLKRFGITDPEILAAGYLHDAKEDAGMGLTRIAGELTLRVAWLVDAVTDGPGKNRRERKKRPLIMIPMCHGALEVKLADRIANVESALATSNPLLKMYAKEFPGLRNALVNRRLAMGAPHLYRMWGYLEHLLKGA
jgi:guanosine-3',5'-bis(diphosphate) 3'-pyrophosphohydrolase